MKIVVITSPEAVKDETVICNLLFNQGLETLHLRKPGAAASTYENFILGIEKKYRNRLVLHDHYQLAEKYNLGGIHLKSQHGADYIKYPNQKISISCHSVEEIKQLPFNPTYCFLSPIFDSISKKGYTSAFPELPDISGLSCPVIALGGITPDRLDKCREAGFAGAAVLGYIWETPEDAVQKFKRLRTPFVMSIAGFDPSCGAGVAADLKTFEANGCYGLGICTALTFQNEDTYTGTSWTSLPDIKRQCELQFRKHKPEYIKIGLIENFDVLDGLLEWLHQQMADIKIIWDPILKATAGEVFHKDVQGKLDRILEKVYLVTPNTEELKLMFGEKVTLEQLQQMARNRQVNILWKGGHNDGSVSTDCLITPETTYQSSLQKSKYSKHGTGCILSSAIASYLSQGCNLELACRKGQVYVSQAIESNDSLLSYHAMSVHDNSALPHPLELKLQYITAPKEGMTLAEQVEAVCRGGMRWVQLRMKNASVSEYIETGKVVKEICHRYNTLFIINDNVEVARQLNADGVHLGKEDMDPIKAREILGEGKIIGATCNTWDDILMRQKQHVDYIGLGPFTYTTTKKKLSPVLGLEGYRQLLEKMRTYAVHIPIFAIGGITENDIPELMKTGIQGIALSGLIKNSNDLTEKTKEVILITDK